MLFAGKFNLLFGLVFGIGFAIQMARLDAAEAARAARLGDAPRRHRATQVYARRLAFLFFVGLVHAMLIWSGDVLLVYALVGFALLGLRRLGDRALYALIAACLVFPALTEALRAALVSRGFETVATFQYQQFQASNDLAYGRGSFLDAMRETARVFDWSWRSPFGLFIVRLVLRADGDRHPGRLRRRPARLAAASARRRGPPSAVRAAALALLVAIGCGVIERRSPSARAATSRLFASAFSPGRSAARRSRRATRSPCAHRPRPARLPRWLRPLRDAGRMPLSNYLLQTAARDLRLLRLGPRLLELGRPGGGDRRWRSSSSSRSSCRSATSGCKRFRYGPLEYLWRRFTYGSAPR